MPRVPSAVLLAIAVLVVSMPLAVAADGTTAETQSTPTAVGLSENTSRVVPLPDTQRSNLSTADSSVMAALRMGASDARWTLSRRVLGERLAAAATENARKRILRNATARAAAAVESLLAREREARQAYLDGTLTTEEYLTTLGELHQRAEHLLQFIGPRDDPVSGSLLSHLRPTDPLESRLFALQAKITPLATEEGATIAAGIRGQATDRVYVGASPNGFVLSRVTSGIYHRSIYRTDFVDDVVEKRLTLTESRNRLSSYYPWAMRIDGGFVSSGAKVFDAVAYQHRVTHSHGTLFAYIDASSGQPYHEVRRTVLSAVPTDPGWTNTSENYTLTVNRSYPGGPLRVSVTYNGTAVETPVFIGGERVGRTDASGVLWTLAPRGEFNVTVGVEESLRVHASI